MARKPIKRKPVSKKPVSSKRTPAKKKLIKESGAGSKLRAKMKEALKKRMQEDQEQSVYSGKSIFKSGQDLQFWKVDSGDHLVDIIPYIAGTQHPTVEEGDTAHSLRVKVHYGLGASEDKSAICLYETYGEPCPICEHRVQLRNEGADEEIWKALFPKKRAIYNILCWDSTKEEEKGIQIWEVAEWYFQKYLDVLVRGARRPGQEVQKLIPFADPDEGKTIFFTINAARSKDSFDEYIGHRFEDRDYQISNELLDGAYTLDELINIPDYQEVYEEYWGEKYEDENAEPEADEEEIEDEEEMEDEEEIDDEEEDEDEEEVDSDEVEDEEDETSSACPGGGEFGVDINELEFCDDCTEWDECLAESESGGEPDEAPAPKKKKPASKKKLVSKKKPEKKRVLTRRKRG